MPKLSVFLAILLIPLETSSASASTHVHLTWNASMTPGIQQYSIWRSTTSGNGNCNSYGLAGGAPCPYTEIATGVACCAFDDYAVTPGTTYFYVVADYAPAPTAATASITMTRSSCPGPAQCIKSIKLLTGGGGYDYGIGWPNAASFMVSGGGPATPAVAPRCTNYNGSAYGSGIQSCDRMCWGNPPSCSGFPGAGYTSTPTIQSVNPPLDMGQMYPGVPGSGLKPAGFSDEISVLYQ